MGKSVIVIEEESLKGEDGKYQLKRSIKATILGQEEVVYEDTVSKIDFVSNSSFLNDFERWVLELHDTKRRSI